MAWKSKTQSVTVGASSGGGAEDMKVQDGLMFNALQRVTRWSSLQPKLVALRRSPNSKSSDPLSRRVNCWHSISGPMCLDPICVRAQQACQCVERPLRELW